MLQLFVTAAVLAAVILWLSPETRQSLRQRSSRLWTDAGLALLALVIVTGRASWPLGLGLAVVLLGHRICAWLHKPDNGQEGYRADGCAYVQAECLAILIDPSSGRIDGTLLSTRRRGLRLSRLALTELLALREDLRDRESADLLEAYLDKAHAGWQALATGRGGIVTNRASGRSKALSEAQAYAILGLADGAAWNEVVAAHRRLIQRLHPDRGGSDYLAARINAAKIRLLRAAGRRTGSPAHGEAPCERSTSDS